MAETTDLGPKMSGTPLIGQNGENKDTDEFFISANEQGM
jgi:hypothetical protein